MLDHRSFHALLSRRVPLQMLSGCLAVLLGWPFAGLVFVPLGLHMMFTSKLGRVALWGVVWSSIVVVRALLGSPRAHVVIL